MRLLKTEWEPGRDPPRGAGSKSLVNFVAEDLLRETISSGVEGSRALSTQSGHRHLVASEEEISSSILCFLSKQAWCQRTGTYRHWILGNDYLGHIGDGLHVARLALLGFHGCRVINISLSARHQISFTYNYLRKQHKTYIPQNLRLDHVLHLVHRIWKNISLSILSTSLIAWGFNSHAIVASCYHRCIVGRLAPAFLPWLRCNRFRLARALV